LYFSPESKAHVGGVALTGAVDYLASLNYAPVGAPLGMTMGQGHVATTTLVLQWDVADV
jgi:hypothetical protein